MQRVHFIGIGGVGMNGLAQLAVHAGYNVCGSDRAYTPESRLFKCLENLGIEIHPQNGQGIDGHTSLVVFSTAIEQDNPDLLEAQKRNIPLLHRAEFLKRLVGGDAELIAVAGTAGKTTTTGMLGWILERLGRDPSVYNGAAVLNWKTSETPGNIRRGSPRLWIIEADESDKSFLHFNPTHSVITNISEDHYALNELHSLFSRFSSQTSETVVHGPDQPLVSLRPNTFEWEGLEYQISMPGRHNLENAFCAVRLCAALDLDMSNVREALAGFRGIERRLEVAGKVDGITVIDDYAHNPAKIAAALAAVTETDATVHAYWRPHGFTPLKQCLNALTDVFASHWKKRGGSIYILPVYYAGGTVQREVTSMDLVRALNSAGVPAQFISDYALLKQALESCVQAGDTILGMGARDPELPAFAKRLVLEWTTP